MNRSLRRLVIKSYHIDHVIFDQETEVLTDGTLKISKAAILESVPGEPTINKIDVQIIKPHEHDRYTETIMDIIPISTKVLGALGEGITHTLTGVYVILTGVDTQGKATHEFGSSEGQLNEQLKLGKAGTPGKDDYIISVDITFETGQGQEVAGPRAGHKVCDVLVQEIRNKLKLLKGDLCTERHEFHDTHRAEKKRVLIVKQVAGQGAMYDTHLFPKEPSGVEGGKSIIEMGNMPVVLTPNEYRDGMIRSMQ